MSLPNNYNFAARPRDRPIWGQQAQAYNSPQEYLVHPLPPPAQLAYPPSFPSYSPHADPPPPPSDPPPPSPPPPPPPTEPRAMREMKSQIQSSREAADLAYKAYRGYNARLPDYGTLKMQILANAQLYFSQSYPQAYHYDVVTSSRTPTGSLHSLQYRAALIVYLKPSNQYQYWNGYGYSYGHGYETWEMLHKSNFCASPEEALFEIRYWLEEDLDEVFETTVVANVKKGLKVKTAVGATRATLGISEGETQMLPPPASAGKRKAFGEMGGDEKRVKEEESE